jgi:CRISPR-associated protein Csh2
LSEEAWRKLGYDPKPDVWVRQLEDENRNAVRVSAKQRIDGLAKEFAQEKGKNYESAKQAVKDPEFRPWLLDKLIDMRIFGATIPVGGEGERERGEALPPLTGPVQFSWGWSLNKTEILPSATISSQFAGREQEEKGQYGTFGKDWRVKYSLLAFYGTISAWRACRTGLTNQDVQLLDRSLLEAVPLLATTRSKLGQTPRLYLRVEYKDDRTFLGDLRTGLRLERDDGLEGIDEVKLDSTGLIGQLERAKDKLEKVIFWRHPDFAAGRELEGALKDALGEEVIHGVQPHGSA